MATSPVSLVDTTSPELPSTTTTPEPPSRYSCLTINPSLPVFKVTPPSSLECSPLSDAAESPEPKSPLGSVFYEDLGGAIKCGHCQQMFIESDYDTHLVDTVAVSLVADGWAGYAGTPKHDQEIQDKIKSTMGLESPDVLTIFKVVMRANVLFSES